jgi:hypothetical protein
MLQTKHSYNHWAAAVDDRPVNPALGAHHASPFSLSRFDGLADGIVLKQIWALRL